ncbi:hypothetical protein C7271_11770 [filamentous cyanobacterium CCP5]|nr:hypothetical protein C7271_11770 [filamentous cyanobacterium CCP5]
MLGAIIGDIVGSRFEGSCPKQFLSVGDIDLLHPDCHFTDDTVLTVAIAAALLHNQDYGAMIHDYYRRYPHAGYGQSFRRWGESDQPEPYNSFGNGSAMRVSPVGFACDALDQVLVEAERTARVTHNHPEGIRGAQATAAAVYLARQGSSKPDLQAYLEVQFGYDLSQPFETLTPAQVTCQDAVPKALIAFLTSQDFEDALRRTLQIGGDTDTIACIAGAIAQGCYGIPPGLGTAALTYLDQPLMAVTQQFMTRYGCL